MTKLDAIAEACHIPQTRSPEGRRVYGTTSPASRRRALRDPITRVTPVIARLIGTTAAFYTYYHRTEGPLPGPATPATTAVNHAASTPPPSRPVQAGRPIDPFALAADINTRGAWGQV